MRTVIRMAGLLVSCGILTGHAATASQLEATLDNGLRVLVRERSEETLITVEMFYAAGAAAEPDSLAGLAHLAEHLLVKGDATSATGSLRRRFALLALASNASTSPTIMSFWSECLPAFLPRILDFEAERMGRIQPDSSVFNREKSVVLEELAYRAGPRATSTNVAAIRASFPAHPYSRAVSGTPESIERITMGDFTEFIACTIHPAAAALVIEGPLDPPTVLDLVRERFADLEGALLGSLPERLRVFPTDGDIPKDELNTTIDEHFVPIQRVEPPAAFSTRSNVWYHIRNRPDASSRR